jgi:hypothetical protein
VESIRENTGIMTPALSYTYGTACSGSSPPVMGSADLVGTEDNAEEDLATGVMYGTSSDLELMDDGGEQLVAVRFPSVDIPAGSTIINAVIGFDVDEIRPGQSDVDVTISVAAEKSTASAVISANDGDLSARTSTSSSVMWQPDASGTEHDMLYTPNLYGVVQEIVNLDGWASGGPICFLFGKIAGAGVRWVEAARENNGVMTPNLVYSYIGTPTATTTMTFSLDATEQDAEEDVATGAMYLTSSDLELISDGGEQVVMVNFPNVDIPQVRVA